MKNSSLYYSVCSLLYCPANNERLVNSIINEKFGSNYSLALCLEDTIPDDCVKEAEEKLIHSLEQLYLGKNQRRFYLPKIFIRVRSPKQIPDLVRRAMSVKEIITGFILPKFSLENADSYIKNILSANRFADKDFYIMPILESPTIINLQNRYSILYALKEKLDRIEHLVLNIRVGGNDLCHMFGFRRHSTESIYNILPVAHIFSDIITVYGMDYVISGPVWEYYSGEQWKNGLIQELQGDKLCGFIGKTVIHPNQIPVVNNAYKVSLQDFEDAKSVLNWDVSSHSLVAGNTSKERMNEYKTHYHWAQKILFLAEIYGIQEKNVFASCL